MTQWALSLWPTTIASSDPSNRLLNYQWSIYLSSAFPPPEGDLIPMSVLPPVLKKGDTLIVLLHLSSRDGSYTIPEGSITLSREVTAPVEFPKGKVTPSSGETLCHWPDTEPYTLPIPTLEFEAFKFRVTVTVETSQGPLGTKVFTVDPEIVVSSNSGP